MATENLGAQQTFTAGEDLSDHQFGCVYLHTTAGQVKIAGAAGNVIGILQNAPESGYLATILTAPGVIARARAGAAISTVGAALESDADGEVVSFTVDGDGTTETTLVGYALETASGENEIIKILTVFAPASK